MEFKRYKNKVNAILEQGHMVTDDDESFLVTYYLCCKFKNNLQEQDYYTSILLAHLE
jgi:hypothetical protein